LVQLNIQPALFVSTFQKFISFHHFSAYWNSEKEEAQKCDSVDISIAVATEKGLMTPIIRNADQKTISAISSEVV